MTPSRSYLRISATPPARTPSPITESDNGLCLAWHQNDITSPSGQQPGTEVWGDVFIDGTTSRRAIRELSRAASSVIMVDDKGDSIAEFRAPVWAPCPQTPQSAELRCWAWANVLASSSISAFPDCSNVVSPACRPKGEQLSGKRAHSGPSLQFYARGAKPAPCTEVAVHRDPDESGIDSAERRRRLGNHHADAAARPAVRLHPSCADKLDAADKLVSHARQTIRLAAHVLHLWPALDLPEAERQVAVPSAAEAPVGSV